MGGVKVKAFGSKSPTEGNKEGKEIKAARRMLYNELGNPPQQMKEFPPSLYGGGSKERQRSTSPMKR